MTSWEKFPILVFVNQSDVRLTRSKIRRILKKRHGSISGIARDLDLCRATVSGVLKGKGTSARVMEAATARAREILASEASYGL